MRLIWGLAFAVCLQGAEAEWAGSQACAACHSEIFETYFRTPMGVGSGPAGTGLIQESMARAEFQHARSGFRYRVRQQGKRFFFEFEGQGDDGVIRGSRELLYYIGSGMAARSYLISAGGFLYEAPVAYYSGASSWNLPPGYDQYPTPYLTRRILPSCLNCHSSGVQLVPGTQNRYRTPPFQEGGVSCERCHGPGAAHVRKMSAGNLDGGPAIVNPAKLPPDRRDSICSQCHLTGLQRVEKPGKEQQVFLAGDRLSDYLTVFVRAGGTPGMRVTSHVEKLAQSACKRGAGDRLWCGSCHNPHFLPGPKEKAAWFRSKCLACHAEGACPAPPASRKANGDDCTACHMPRSQVVDADHVVFTDHSIPRRPRPPGPLPPTDAPLVPFGGGEAGARDLGLAYAIVAERDKIPAYRERAFPLLRKAMEDGARDPQTLLYLAEFYRSRGDDQAAIPLYEEVLRADPAQVAASVALGTVHAERGQFKDAIRLWSDALARSPALAGVRAALALILVREGNIGGARKLLETALEFDPAHTPSRRILQQLRQATPPPPGPKLPEPGTVE